MQTVQRLRSHLRPKDGFWSEASGALGDLGTFVPIAVALTLVNKLDLGTTLLFSGAYNILTGLLFGVPMPVQPMKSIAAVAISSTSPLTLPQIAAAGISTAAVLLFLSLTGLMALVHRLLPMSVVRGIQLSQGLSFGITAVHYILKLQNFSTSKSSGDRPWLGLDGILLALLSFVFIILVTGSGDRFAEPQQPSLRRRQSDSPPIAATLTEGEDDNFDAVTPTAKPSSSNLWASKLEMLPTALIIFLVGIVLAFVRRPSIWSSLTVGPSKPTLLSISWSDWKTGFLKAAVPQIPLSILNSVIAVCKLSSDLFPDKIVVTPTSVSASVGIMNMLGCWFGAMPVCHGAGGLAGQCRFGATSGAAVVLLGTCKIMVGLLLGSSLVELLSEFPVGLLGVLLLFAGVELAMACRDQNSRSDSFVMIVTTAVSLGSNAAKGFAAGLVLHLLLVLRRLRLSSVMSLRERLLRRGRNTEESPPPPA